MILCLKFSGRKLHHQVRNSGGKWRRGRQVHLQLDQEQGAVARENRFGEIWGLIPIRHHPTGVRCRGKFYAKTFSRTFASSFDLLPIFVVLPLFNTYIVQDIIKIFTFSFIIITCGWRVALFLERRTIFLPRPRRNHFLGASRFRARGGQGRGLYLPGRDFPGHVVARNRARHQQHLRLPQGLFWRCQTVLYPQGRSEACLDVAQLFRMHSPRRRKRFCKGNKGEIFDVIKQFCTAPHKLLTNIQCL